MLKLDLLSDHPRSVGETYLQHQRVAFGFGLRMIGGGLACLVHGVLPFLCVTTASRQIAGLHERMVLKRRSHVADAAATRG